jgi:hypothetical protein
VRSAKLKADREVGAPPGSSPLALSSPRRLCEYGDTEEEEEEEIDDESDAEGEDSDGENGFAVNGSSTFEVAATECTYRGDANEKGLKTVVGSAKELKFACGCS